MPDHDPHRSRRHPTIAPDGGDGGGGATTPGRAIVSGGADGATGATSGYGATSATNTDGADGADGAGDAEALFAAAFVTDRGLLAFTSRQYASAQLAAGRAQCPACCVFKRFPQAGNVPPTNSASGTLTREPYYNKEIEP